MCEEEKDVYAVLGLNDFSYCTSVKHQTFYHGFIKIDDPLVLYTASRYASIAGENMRVTKLQHISNIQLSVKSEGHWGDQILITRGLC